MRDLFKEFGSPRSLGGGGSGGGGGGGSFDISGVKNLGDIAVKAAGALNSLHDGTLTAKTALTTFAGALNQIPMIGSTLGGLTKTFGDAILNSNAALNAHSKFGANFNNDLAEMDRAVLGARMTQDQYNEMLRHGSTALTGLGSTVNRSQENFLGMSKQLQESKFVNQMKELGVSAEDVAQIAYSTMANRRGIDLSSAAAQKAAAESAIALTAAMEETTRITGLSKEAQAKELEKRTQNVQVQATLMQMDEAKFDDYLQMQEGLMALGPGVQDLADEIVTGGIRTEAGAAKLAALGEAGPELEAALKQVMAAQTDGEKHEAQLRLKAAESRVNEYQTSKGFLDTVRFATGAVADESKSMMSQNAGVRSKMAKVAEVKASTGKDIGLEQAAKEQSRDVRRGMAGLDETGKPIDTAGATVAKTLNNVDRTLKDATAGSAEQFKGLVNTTAGVINKFDGLSGLTIPRTQEAFGSLISQIPGIPKAKLSLPAAVDKGGKITNADQAAAPIAPPVKPENSFADGTPNFENFLQSGGAIKGMFNQFDPKGELAMLHGNELVANESQMNRFMSKMIPPDIGAGKAGMDSATVSKIVSDVFNSVSTRTPGDKSDPNIEVAKKAIDDMTATFKDFKLPEIKPEPEPKKEEPKKEEPKIKPEAPETLIKNVTDKMVTSMTKQTAEVKPVIQKPKEAEVKNPFDELTTQFSSAFKSIIPEDKDNKESNIFDNFPKFDTLFADLGNKIETGIKPPKPETTEEKPKEEPATEKPFDLGNMFSDIGKEISTTLDKSPVGTFGKDIGNFFGDLIKDKPAEKVEPAKENNDELNKKVDAAIDKANKDAIAHAKEKEANVETAKVDAKKIEEKPEQAKTKTEHLTFKQEFQQTLAQIKRFDPNTSLNNESLKKTAAPPPPAPVPLPPPEPKPEPKPEEKPSVVGKDITLKDLHDALIMLNTSMNKMISHTDQISDASQKQLQATRSLSANRLA